jgi:Holliday junction resolvase RusA-like endonuclease
VYGEPVAQGRPRATTVNGHVRMYDPAKSRDYKDYVRLAAAQHAPERLIESAIGLKVTVYRAIPKSFSKKKTELAERGEIVPTTKPDADNYLKTVKDALNGVIWKDDSQIVDVQVRKRYSNKPRIEIEIHELF